MDEPRDCKRTLSKMEKLSLETNIFEHPRGLLQRCFPNDQTQLSTGAKAGNPEEIELTLGLSLGGKFGVDKLYANKNKLIRSCSIADIPIEREEEVVAPPTVLARTCSLPAETEQEWRKRKRLQKLRRMAAKRRRSEKQRSFTGEPQSQSETRLLQASPTVIESLQERSNQEASSSFMKSSSKKPGTEDIGDDETGSSSTEDMPLVFTQGDGPNGRKIGGILYRYGKGKKVRIMCVCHGSFLSPAEFVNHAGVRDVAHPLKHIVVDPSSTLAQGR